MRAPWIVSVIGVVAACGGSGVDIDTSADNVCGQIAEVGCHDLFQCCAEGEIEDYLGVSDPRTEEECQSDLEKRCERLTASLRSSLDANRVRFDADVMNTCLRSILAPGDVCADVETMLPWTEGCMNTAWVGTVATDGACQYSFDCTGYPDNYCAANQKCVARPTQGFPCGTGCASDFYCAAGICQARLPVSAPCTASNQCQDDLFCDVTAMPQPVCAARLPGGSMCTSNTGCESGQCIPGACMGTGSTCYRDADCLSHCANSTTTCTTSANCGTGTCSVGGNPCTLATQCVGGATDVCVFPVLCLPGDCIGDPVCTVRTFTVDYCTGALGALPVI